MWLRRLAALAAAVALVAGAFALRDRRASTGGSATATTAAGGTVSDTAPTKGFTLVCATELRALCEGTLGSGVTVRIEPVATTAAAFATGPRAVAIAWLTIDPWPGLSDGRRPAGGTAFGTPTRLASSPVGVAIRKPRNTKLASACDGGTITLACVGDKGGTAWTALGGLAEWQVLKPTVTDPLTSASGPASLAAAVREQRKDQGLALIDLQSDGSFNTWLRNFLRPTGSVTALEQAVLQTAYDAVVVPQAEFTATAAPSGRFAFEGASTFSAELVLAPVAGVTVPKSIMEALTAQATKAGWLAGAAPTAALDANLVAGMQTVWKENA